MSTRLVIGLLFLAAAVAMGWFALSGKPLPFVGTINTDNTSQTGVPEGSQNNVGGSLNESGLGDGTEKGGIAERSVVTYTDSGFGPSEITVEMGATVAFVNESSRQMWVASGVYPSNQLLPDFNQNGAAGKGGVYEYTFTKVGTWQYQNDKNPDDIGYVIVQ